MLRARHYYDTYAPLLRHVRASTSTSIYVRTRSRPENEPNTDNPVVLFGQPIETPRSAPTIGQGAAITPEVLRRILGAHSNGVVANNPRNGHSHYPDPAVPPPSPTNPGRETRGEASTSTRRARLDMNEVD